MLINKSAVKRLVHSKGFHVSIDTLKALDEIIESQVSGAITAAVANNRKILKRCDSTPLFPLSGKS